MGQRNPERVAWAILWLSFLVLCAILFGGWQGVSNYLAWATAAREARLEILSGTVLLREPGTKNEVNVPGTVPLREGTAIRTTAGSQAIVWLPDGSNVRLWPSTALEIQRLRFTVYNSNASEMVLKLSAGHTRVEVALPATVSRRFVVLTPNAEARLREGSYGLDVQSGQTEVSTRYGSATVEASNHSVEVLQRERVVVPEGAAPSDPTPAIWNLVRNGQFSPDLSGWQSGNRDEEEAVVGRVEATMAYDRPVAHFSRQGATKHAETFLFQPIGRDVSDYQRLILTLDLKLLNQSLSGGGWRGSEYPLMVRLRYHDAYGSEVMWVRGFYYQNKGKLPTNDGQQVPQNEWVRFELNLFDPQQVSPRPVDVISLEICASGWDYDSQVANVSLLAE